MAVLFSPLESAITSSAVLPSSVLSRRPCRIRAQFHGEVRGVSVRLPLIHFSHGQLHLSREDSRRQHSSRSVGSWVSWHWIVDEIDDPAATVIDSFVSSEDSTFPYCFLFEAFLLSSWDLLFVFPASRQTRSST